MASRMAGGRSVTSIIVCFRRRLEIDWVIATD
jgi:hypothetical protein